jgi:hypothetical protein
MKGFHGRHRGLAPVQRKVRRLAGFAAAALMACAGSASASTVSYTYDALGRVKSAAYSSGKTILYFYDAAGNRTQVTTCTSGSVLIWGQSNWGTPNTWC